MIQLQNFVSLTTTGTSGAATLSNGVLNVPNYDTSGGGAWVDYSATSTIVGWSSFTTKQIRYRIVGKQIFVYFYLAGTSNSVNVTFTLPNNSINLQRTFSSCVNNGVAAGACITVASNASNIIEIGANSTTTSNFTASGTKSCLGQFFIEIA